MGIHTLRSLYFKTLFYLRLPASDTTLILPAKYDLILRHVPSVYDLIFLASYMECIADLKYEWMTVLPYT